MAPISPSQGWLPELLAADRVAELDQPTERAAGDDHVVDGDLRRLADLDVDRRERDRPDLARERARDPRLEVVGGDRRQEADAAVVDAEHRDAGAEEARERLQHRPVAAEHDDEIGAAVAVDHLDARCGGDRAHALRRVLGAFARRRARSN